MENSIAKKKHLEELKDTLWKQEIPNADSQRGNTKRTEHSPRRTQRSQTEKSRKYPTLREHVQPKQYAGLQHNQVLSKISQNQRSSRI